MKKIQQKLQKKNQLEIQQMNRWSGVEDLQDHHVSRMKIHLDFHNRISVLGGTLFSIVPNLSTSDLVVTCILGIVGAFVSFVSSLFFRMFWKFISEKIFKKNRLKK